MDKLTAFSPMMDVNAYIPCSFVVLHQQLLLLGSKSNLFLFTSLQLQSLPNFVKPNQAEIGYIRGWETNRLGYKGSLAHLGATFARKQADNYEDGLSVIRQNIKDGVLTIATGSMYQIPYSKEYKNLSVYPNPMIGLAEHWITIYGLSSSEVLVYDPIPNNYLGALALPNFKEFWEGDRLVPELQHLTGLDQLSIYGYREIHIQTHSTDEDVTALFFKTLKTISYEYLRGASIEVDDVHYYFGKTALEQFICNLKVMQERSSRDIQGIRSFENNIIGVKYSRYFLRDLLQEMSRLFGQPYRKYLHAIEMIIQSFEMLCNIYSLNLKRTSVSGEFISKVIALLEDVMKKEIELHEIILKEHEHTALLDSL